MLSLDLKPHIDYMASVDQGWLKYWYKIRMITNKHKNIQYIVKIIIYYNDTIITGYLLIISFETIESRLATFLIP